MSGNACAVNRANKGSAITIWAIVRCVVGGVGAEHRSLGRVGTLWTPYVKSNLEDPTFKDTVFDVIATAMFIHQQSGEQRTTGRFSASGKSWKFRFTGTRTGRWSFTTESADADLDGRRGKMFVVPDPKSNPTGCITHLSNKWVHRAT